MLGDIGFIANRRRLMGELGLDPAVPDAAIFEALWNRFGPSGVERVCGAYTAMVWDQSRERLILAVDRLGIHPLYVRESGEERIVSAELGNVFGPASSSIQLNRLSLIAQLHGQALPPGATFFAGITATRAATLTEFSRTGSLERKYWTLAGLRTLGARPGDDWTKRLSELLIEVTGEYASGEPAGVTLSSGLDSTSVALAWVRARPAESLTALSWSAPELPEADETSGARAVSERLGLRFVPVRADLCWTLEGDTDLCPPLAGPPLTFFARLWRETFAIARESGLGLLLSGASGDHLFGGRIEPAADLLLTGRWSSLREELARQGERSGESLCKQWRHRILGPMVRAYGPRPRSVAPPLWLEPEVQPEARHAVASEIQPLLPGRRERWRRLQDPLLPRILAETTAAAREAGITLRHPLVDHRLVELAAALPSQACYRFGKTKTILRDLLRGELPDEVVERPTKIVPGLIARRGLREREVPKALGLMTNMRLAAMDLVNESRLRAHYREFLDQGSGSSSFWHTLSLEAWLRCHGDRFATA